MIPASTKGQKVTFKAFPHLPLSAMQEALPSVPAHLLDALARSMGNDGDVGVLGCSPVPSAVPIAAFIMKFMAVHGV